MAAFAAPVKIPADGGAAVDNRKFTICLQRSHDFFLKLLYDDNQQRGHTPMRFLPPKTHTTHPKNPAAYAAGFLGAAGLVQRHF